jgi:hypothetical protein
MFVRLREIIDEYYGLQFGELRKNYGPDHNMAG